LERERKSRKEGGPVILKFRVVFHFYATDNSEDQGKDIDSQVAASSG
jgi:hypothetical protein